MIEGEIEEFKTTEGGILYRGWCVVKREKGITAAVVLNGQIPEGPPPGWKRSTLKWVESKVQDSDVPTYMSRVDFEILDYLEGTHVGAVEKTVPLAPDTPKTAGRNSKEGSSMRDSNL